MDEFFSINILIQLQFLAAASFFRILDAAEKLQDRNHRFIQLFWKCKKEALDDAKQQFDFVFKRMEAVLSEGPWLCGEDYSLADIACAPIIDRLGQCEWLDLFEPYPHLLIRSSKIRERDAFKQMRPKDNERFTNLEL